MTTYSFQIPAGTKVFRVSNAKGGIAQTVVELKAPADVVGATRHEDGGFGYSVSGQVYYTSAGVVTSLTAE